MVPVAGLGTRLQPATLAVPKEMLALVDRPVVQHVVEELAGGGIERVLLVTARRKPAIEQHFEAVPLAGVRLAYAHQARPRGLGDAVRCGQGFAGGRPVVVALGDAVIDPPGIVGRLIEAHRATGAAAAIAVTGVASGEVGRYGIVVGRGGPDGFLEVDDVVEKPDPEAVSSRLAIAGRYVLGPEVFAALGRARPGASGEIGLTESLSSLARSGRPVVAVALEGWERRLDIGSLEGYCEAFVELALRHPRLGARLRARAAELLDEGG